MIKPSLFLVGTPGKARAYLTKLLTKVHGSYPRFVVPCAGRFSGPLAAIAAGYSPESIEASDVSLSSSIIGYIASGRDPHELGAVVNVPGIDELNAIGASATDPVAYGAAVLLAQRLGGLEPRNASEQIVADDMRHCWRRHLVSVARGLKALTDQLRGIRYQRADMIQVVVAAATDPAAILYIDPSGATKKRDKHFDSKGAVTAPEFASEPFVPAQGFRLQEQLHCAPALGLVMRDGKSLGNDSATAVWALHDPPRIRYITANRPAEVRNVMGGIQLDQKKTEPKVQCDWPVWGGATDTIREDSHVRFMQVRKEVGFYYRDLFARTLGTTDCNMTFVMFVDDKVFGVLGLHTQFANRGRSYDDDGRIWIFGTFGFSARHPAYPRHLNRLLMMCLTCQEFGNMLPAISPILRYNVPVGIRTVCITKGHESKGNRGILKLISRELRSDGRHHLIYATEWRKGTFADQVKTWVKKYANQQAGRPNAGEDS